MFLNEVVKVYTVYITDTTARPSLPFHCHGMPPKHRSTRRVCTIAHQPTVTVWLLHCTPHVIWHHYTLHWKTVYLIHVTWTLSYIKPALFLVFLPLSRNIRLKIETIFRKKKMSCFSTPLNSKKLMYFICSLLMWMLWQPWKSYPDKVLWQTT